MSKHYAPNPICSCHCVPDTTRRSSRPTSNCLPEHDIDSVSATSDVNRLSELKNRLRQEKILHECTENKYEDLLDEHIKTLNRLDELEQQLATYTPRQSFWGKWFNIGSK